VREHKSVEIPEGLDNERIDSALARILGLSRSVIVRLLESDEVTMGHRVLSKSDKVLSGQTISVVMPRPPSGIAIPPTLT
jgi:23S rRNA pseudouridine1911/1915/1917 synthase